MEQIAPSTPYKDRTTGLMVFGIFEILLGLAAGVIGLMILVVGLVGKLPNVSSPWVGSAFYLAVGAVLIWLGIGSIMARRWARALILMLSWTCLISGIISGIALFFIMPGMMDQLGQTLPGEKEAQVVKWITLAAMGFFMLVFYIVIPGAMVLFYRSPHVKATCEAKDSKASWTDACPLQVLTVSLLMGISALFMAAFMPGYGFVFPFFGTLVSGVAGALVTFVLILILAYLCWALYRMRAEAWWATMAFSIVTCVSSILTFSRVNLLEMYQMMNFPEQTIEIIRKTGLLESDFMLYILCATFAIWLGYLIYIKKYFNSK